MPTQAEKWAETFAKLDAENKAAGRCPNCGGSGVVAAMREIDRTGNPYANRRCGRCKGTGQYRTRTRKVGDRQRAETA